jgi:poly(hydroxyalkanoate) depolymerase family esterase
MARKLSTLFFSMAQRMVRDQQRALKRASKAAVAMSARAMKRGALAGNAPTAGDARRRPAATPPVPGEGKWEGHIHKGSTAVGQWHGRLAYHLYLPAAVGSPADAAGMPLVVMLHGCQQTVADFARGTRMNRLADKEGFVIAWPQQSANAQSQRCWRWFRPQHGYGGSEADAIASLARALVEKLQLDVNRVYVAGLSAGAGMAALTALRHADVFAAVGLHSGAVMGDAYHVAAGMAAMRRGSRRDILDQARQLLGTSATFSGMPAIIVHGGRDRTVDIRNARQLVEQFRDLNGIDPAQAPSTATLGAGTIQAWQREDLLVAGQPVVRLAYVPTLGHAWSGGDPTIRFHDATGPGAGLLFWRFFQGHWRQTAVDAPTLAQGKPGPRRVQRSWPE